MRAALCVWTLAAPSVMRAQAVHGPPAPGQLTATQFTDYALRFMRYRPKQSSPRSTTVLLLHDDFSEARASEIAQLISEHGPKIANAQFQPRMLSVASARETLRTDFANASVVLAIDVPAAVLPSLSTLSREFGAFTISTRLEDLFPKNRTQAMFSLAIVGETTSGGLKTQVRAYRNDDALSKEKIKLPRDVLALTRPVTTDPQENYRLGIRAFDFEEWAEVRTRMEAALMQRTDDSRSQVAIYGNRVQAYVPSLYLGAAFAQQGDCSRATDYLRRYGSVSNLTSEERELIRFSNSLCARGGLH